MNNFQKLSILLAITGASASFAQAPKVNCVINPITKLLEPTKPWLELLGDEAIVACKNIMSASHAQKAAGTTLTTPAMPIQQVKTTNNMLPVNVQPSLQLEANKASQTTRPNSLTNLPANSSVSSTQASSIPLPFAASPQPISAQTQVKKMQFEKNWVVDLTDITLSTTFARWANTAGYRMRWDADKNVIIDAPDNITGTFEEAVDAVLSSPGITNSVYPLEVCFYANTPPLARITRKGEQKDCK